MARDKATKAKAADAETPTCPTCGVEAIPTDPGAEGFVCDNDDCPDHGELVG